MKYLLAFLAMIGAQLAQAGVRSQDVLLAPETRPITIVLPAGKPRAIILFSHGAFSSPAKYTAITQRWAERGYAVIAPLHADSEVWAGAKPTQAESTGWRIADMEQALAKLPQIERETRARLTRLPVIAAGHSFGALVAAMLPDPKIRAVMLWSPPGPNPMLTLPVVRVPVLTITGTADVLPPFTKAWEEHLAIHNQAKAPLAIAVIANQANHYFGNIIGRTEYSGPPQQAGFDAAMAASLLFLDGVALGNRKARSALLTMTSPAAAIAVRAR